ncbi:MAG: hypothetical protein JSS62_01825 [Verrucomicrobia bacterium]|nr:hypothetical protein [Verrucomicrobiota bacterium]MBS0645670.1 hypothetical protein [Verrucomicrobiota bacterium]
MEENKWISQIKAHWKKGFYVLLLIACVSIWSERLYRRQQHSASHDYLVMRQIFDRFKQAHPIAEESLEVAERVVKKHPQLHPSYDAMLAQYYLAKQDTKHAAAYAHAIIKRTSAFVHPHFSAFAYTTASIINADYDKAYAQALQLEDSVKGDENFEHLRAFNLLRLIFLAQRTGHKDACNEWNITLQGLPSYSSIADLFELGDLSLQDYLKTS